jgi:aminoglycoside phosphotransferase family enzyme/predicted kinase
MERHPARAVETHVSTLFFVGERVYKLKKAVSLGFLDFSSREARRAACHREVELNRRLAPDVYLGVADIVGPDGEMCDHLVVMRRMPEERRLETLLAAGDPVDAELRAVARAVAVFHARSATSDAIAAAGTAAAVRATWEANIAGLRPFVGTLVDTDLERRVEARAERFLDGRAPLLERRIAEGRVRDGHGDLLTADIFCLPDGPRILDCIEFDDRLRHADVLADVAFLAMDLERLGRPDLAQRFLDHYREFSGDTFPTTLAHHYIAYRAHVRAKVACLRHQQGDAGAAAQAEQLLRMAFVHAEEARVSLTLVGGLPGTGKSTLAAAVADALGWTVLRSDEVRRDLAGLHPTTAPPAAYGEGLHTAAMTERTYAELLRRAERLLVAGEPVVLDATWSDRRWRALAQDLTRSTASDLVELECRAPREVAESRIAARLAAGADISDATPAIARRMAASAHPWPGAVHVDTTHGIAAALAAAMRAIGETGAGATGRIPDGTTPVAPSRP